MSDSPYELTTRCCIAGGGPAGMMLGYLLARAGVDVVVLEKWPDFFRDFRGDTIHPSTLEVLRALGLLQDFLALKPDRAETLGGVIGGLRVTVATSPICLSIAGSSPSSRNGTSWIFLPARRDAIQRFICGWKRKPPRSSRRTGEPPA